MNAVYLLLVLFYLLFIITNASDSSDKTCKVNGNCGLPDSKSIIGSNIPSYNLAAGGMRRKNLLVVNVDVYNVGVYISPKMENILKNNIKAGKKFELYASTGEDVSVSIYLKFVRSVTTDKIVQAFKEGLTINDKNAVNSFTSILLKKLGPNGASNDDTIEFIFKGKNNEDIGILVRDDKVPEIVKSASLRERLIEIYTGKDSIVPEIPKQLSDKYKKIDI